MVSWFSQLEEASSRPGKSRRIIDNLILADGVGFFAYM
jgi:hypothetical protein